MAGDLTKISLSFKKKDDFDLPWWRTLIYERQRVLANMAFNLGIDGLLGFRHTLLAMEQGRYDEAVIGMMGSKWAGQVGDRAVRLAKMMKGTVPVEVPVPVAPIPVPALPPIAPPATPVASGLASLLTSLFQLFKRKPQ